MLYLDSAYQSFDTQVEQHLVPLSAFEFEPDIMCSGVVRREITAETCNEDEENCAQLQP